MRCSAVECLGTRLGAGQQCSRGALLVPSMCEGQHNHILHATCCLSGDAMLCLCVLLQCTVQRLQFELPAQHRQLHTHRGVDGTGAACVCRKGRSQRELSSTTTSQLQVVLAADPCLQDCRVCVCVDFVRRCSSCGSGCVCDTSRAQVPAVGVTPLRPVAYWLSMLAWRSCAPLLLPPLLSSRVRYCVFPLGMVKKIQISNHAAAAL